MSLRISRLRFARPANFFRGRLANLRVNKLTSVARSILPSREGGELNAVPYAFPSEIIPLPFFHSPVPSFVNSISSAEFRNKRAAVYIRIIRGQYGKFRLSFLSFRCDKFDKIGATIVKWPYRNIYICRRQ